MQPTGHANPYMVVLHICNMACMYISSLCGAVSVLPITVRWWWSSLMSQNGCTASKQSHNRVKAQIEKKVFAFVCTYYSICVLCRAGLQEIILCRGKCLPWVHNVRVWACIMQQQYLGDGEKGERKNSWRKVLVRKSHLLALHYVTYRGGQDICMKLWPSPDPFVGCRGSGLKERNLSL